MRKSDENNPARKVVEALRWGRWWKHANKKRDDDHMAKEMMMKTCYKADRLSKFGDEDKSEKDYSQKMKQR